MVTFIPPYCGEEIKSNAEKKIFSVLQELDLKNTYVFHSLGLPKHQSKIYGEIDFVIVCEYGVACLEIKGGRVECNGGEWLFTDRYGIQRKKSEGPFAQVIGNMFSLRDTLKKKFENNQHIRKILMACGVVFPDIVFQSDSQELIPEIVYDKRTTDITEYICNIFRYWRERQNKEPARLSPEDVKTIVNYLRGEFTFIPTLGDRLDNVESRLVRLTNEQTVVIDALSVNSHLLIEGKAGTGKTLLALHYAKKEAEQGKKVLYITFNKNISNSIRAQIKENQLLKVINIHALFGEMVSIDISRLKNNATEYFAEDLPEAFCQWVSSLEEIRLTQYQYDVLVIDEGQDILKPNYLIALDYLLKGGFENGIWAVFYDEEQNIYNSEFDDGLALLMSYSCARFRLFINCRNTIQIGTFGAMVGGSKFAGFLKENGEEVQKIFYSDDADFKVKIKNIINTLRKENVSMKDVVFLSPKKYEATLLYRVNIPVNELNDKFDAGIDRPVYATIQGFKGLDAKVVIIIGVEDIWHENYAKFMYIAATRARTMLYVVEKEENK